MIERDLGPRLLKSAAWYPVVTVVGPRQSGKTTLARACFPDLPYVSLEPLDVREGVRADPRGFLAEHPEGAVVDEVQHVPELLPYLQVDVDADPRPGRFVLTGSQQLGLMSSVTQSLAGRTAVLTLLPPSYRELLRFPAPPTDLWTAVWSGAFPRIWNVGIPPAQWYADYTATYVERDVRSILDVGNLRAFRTFVELCAGRTAQELNLDSLGADAGIARNTARAWLSVLEAGFLAVALPAWTPNARKRAIKAPKLHLRDTGLACHLLGIASPDQLRTHPLRGALFETWVATEVEKARANRGLSGGLSHYRETRGVEVDLVVEHATRTTLVEIKSGATIASDWFDGLRELREREWDGERPRGVLVHGGDADGTRTEIAVQSWRTLHELDWGGLD
ncbi:MAG: ATP-binding protein [Sporichthyaceae bacterium]